MKTNPLDPTLRNLKDCGCCAGTEAETPAAIENRPGLPRITFRAGTHAQFKASLLAALSDAKRAQLGKLSTREDDDFTIALLDGFAAMADVLTFYSERIANEGFLRTATERRSVLELAREIGYELRPGVAASTWLAFTIEDAPGAPKHATIDIGAKVQSIPGAGEQPQIFETVEAIDARAEWNALRPQTTALIIPKMGDKATYLQGVATNLKPGDGLLFVGTEREGDPKNENWDFRLLTNVEPDGANGRTLVTWEEGLGSVSPHVAPAANPRVFAFRQRAAVFGYNAPEWRTIPDTTKALYLGLDDPRELIDEVVYSETKEWPNFTILAPTSKPKPQAVPDRVIQPTRESVAAVATTAAAIQVAAAVKLASDAAHAAEAAAKNARDATQPAITAAENTATQGVHDALAKAIQTVTNLNTATQFTVAITDILNQAAGKIWLPFAIDAAGPLAFAQSEIFKGDIRGLNNNDQLGQRLEAIAQTIRISANAAINTAEAAITTNAIPAAAQATFSPLAALINAAQTFATNSAEAAAITQTAVIIATLIKAVLELPEKVRPPHANAMAVVIDAIADLAANVTFQGASPTSALAGLTSAANNILRPVAAGIKAINLGLAVKTAAEKVRDAVKDAVAKALIPLTLPRPARRDIFEPFQDTIDLDTIYQKITPGSWLVLSRPSYQEVYQITRVVEASRAEFSLTAKTTRVTLQGEHLKEMFEKEVRTTTVFAQTEELEIAETPLPEPVYGARIALSQLVPGLMPKQALAVSGKRTQVMVTAKGLLWVSANGSKSVVLQPDDVLSVMTSPGLISASGGQSVALTPEQLVALLASSPPASSPPPLIQWHLMDRDGATGFVTAPYNSIKLHAAAKDDRTVSEVAFIGTPAGAVSSNRERTIITLREPLQNCYDRATVVIYANLAAATNGETKSEVLGSGDASQPYQQFTLKQSPLTYISSAGPSGADSTLQVRVNDLLWHEVPAFYGHGPHERIFVTRIGDDGKTTVKFGDGQTGARLPTGQENVTAHYRKGIGTAGNLKAEQLSLLMTRPLGVKAVTNPDASGGAQNPEPLNDARRNAPLQTLTLGRVVSLQDYEDFACAFGGIAKALATWVWTPQGRGVFVTVALPGGTNPPPTSRTLDDLKKALHDFGNPLVPLKVVPGTVRQFALRGEVVVQPDRIPEKVKAGVDAVLRGQFKFDARQLGQNLALSEIIALIQNVSGVESIALTKFDFAVPIGAADQVKAMLVAQRPQPGDAQVAAQPAEVLVLAEDSLTKLEVKAV